MKKNQLWLAAVILLISGGIIGFISGATVARIQIVRTIQQGPDAVRQVVMKRLTRKLSLNQEQQASVSQTVAAAQVQLSILREEQKPKIKLIVQKAVEDMKKVLTPEQQATLDQMRGNFQKHWE
ncbi:MAG: hypothetical protein V2A34_09590 [Lentisphaerota bacterium]